ncbi:MAG: NAD(P)/FAD-dependent oxidoreductase [Saprospiraceae bacterium]|nr:NAD(P)/FAD-dependent oxidoreductase [Saprospiraceae bacterium]
MDRSQLDYDVIIVGAGPVGLSMAHYLSKYDLRIAVFEKNEHTVEHSRAPAIWPGTQEILSEIGVLEKFQNEGIAMPALDVWDVDRERVILHLPFKELSEETPYPQLLILPQARTESILLERLESRKNVKVFFSREVVTLNEFDSHVGVNYHDKIGENSASAGIVVGADGAHSVVRQKIGASFTGKTYPVVAALADITLAENKPFTSPRITNRSVLSIGIRISPDTWRLILPVQRNEELSLAERIKLAVEGLFGDCKWDEVWKSEFKIHNRLSSMFARHRVVLVGDAAHLNSPVGGQGMNAGIQDVPPWAELISEVVVSGDLESLEDYGEKRRNELRSGVNRFTDIMTWLFLLLGEGRLIKPMLRVLNLLLKIKIIQKRILRRIMMIRGGELNRTL